MKNIEVGGSYKTTDGHSVQIYAVYNDGNSPIHGAVLMSDGVWSPHSWKKNGTSASYGPHAWDIVIPPPKFEGVTRINSYFGGHSILFVPDEFAGFEFEYTLKVLDQTEPETENEEQKINRNRDN